MALIRSNKAGAGKDFIVWFGMQTSANSAFYSSDGTLLETTGGNFTNKYGISMTHGSGGAYTVTNNTGNTIICVHNDINSGTLTTIADGQSANTDYPVLVIPV